jgi:hypothetical protein
MRKLFFATAVVVAAFAGTVGSASADYVDFATARWIMLTHADPTVTGLAWEIFLGTRD